MGDIPVPQTLVEGIPVLRVYATGVTRRATLSLSSDKFTLFVKQERPIKKKSFLLSSPFTKQKGISSSSSLSSSLPSSSDTNNKKSNNKNDDIDQTGQRGIDIGAISKIQRGHTRHRRIELARYVSFFICFVLFGLQLLSHNYPFHSIEREPILSNH